MTWAQRLKRVFNIDIETCQACGGQVSIIPKALAAIAGQAPACIEDSVVIKQILDHQKKKAEANELTRLPESRARPFGLPAGFSDRHSNVEVSTPMPMGCA